MLRVNCGLKLEKSLTEAFICSEAWDTKRQMEEFIIELMGDEKGWWIAELNEKKQLKINDNKTK